MPPPLSRGVLLEGYLPSALEIADRFTLEAARRHFSRRIVPEGEAHLLIDLDGHEKPVRLSHRGADEFGQFAGRSHPGDCFW